MQTSVSFSGGQSHPLDPSRKRVAVVQGVVRLLESDSVEADSAEDAGSLTVEVPVENGPPPKGLVRYGQQVNLVAAGGDMKHCLRSRGDFLSDATEEPLVETAVYLTNIRAGYRSRDSRACAGALLRELLHHRRTDAEDRAKARDGDELLAWRAKKLWFSSLSWNTEFVILPAPYSRRHIADAVHYGDPCVIVQGCSFGGYRYALGIEQIEDSRVAQVDSLGFVLLRRVDVPFDENRPVYTVWYFADPANPMSTAPMSIQSVGALRSHGGLQLLADFSDAQPKLVLVKDLSYDAQYNPPTNYWSVVPVTSPPLPNWFLHILADASIPTAAEALTPGLFESTLSLVPEAHKVAGRAEDGAVDLGVQELLLVEDCLHCLFGVSGEYISLQTQFNQVDSYSEDPFTPKELPRYSHTYNTLVQLQGDRSEGHFVPLGVPIDQSARFDSAVAVDESLRRMTDKIMTAIHEISLVRHLAEYNLTPPTTQTNEALGAALKYVLKELEMRTAELEVWTGRTCLSLQRLWSILHTAKPTLHLLFSIGRQVYGVEGPSILDRISRVAAECVSQEAMRTAATYLLTATAQPFERMLNIWLSSGKVDDPRGEFFIAEEPRLLNHRTPISRWVYKDHRFIIFRQQMPEIIQPIAQTIKEIGQYWQILREVLPAHEFAHAIANIPTARTVPSRGTGLSGPHFAGSPLPVSTIPIVEETASHTTDPHKLSSLRYSTSAFSLSSSARPLVRLPSNDSYQPDGSSYDPRQNPRQGAFSKAEEQKLAEGTDLRLFDSDLSSKIDLIHAFVVSEVFRVMLKRGLLMERIKIINYLLLHERSDVVEDFIAAASHELEDPLPHVDALANIWSKSLKTSTLKNEPLAKCCSLTCSKTSLLTISQWCSKVYNTEDDRLRFDERSGRLDEERLRSDDIRPRGPRSEASRSRQNDFRSFEDQSDFDTRSFHAALTIPKGPLVVGCPSLADFVRASGINTYKGDGALIEFLDTFRDLAADVENHWELPPDGPTDWTSGIRPGFASSTGPGFFVDDYDVPFDAVHFATLIPDVPWPLHLVVDTEAVLAYQSIFRLLMLFKVVQRRLWMIWKDCIQIQAKSKSLVIDSVLRLRHKMHLIVNAILCYLVDDVVRPETEELMTSLRLCETLGAFQTTHKHFLKTLMYKCLFSHPKAFRPLIRLLTAILSFVRFVTQLLTIPLLMDTAPGDENVDPAVKLNLDSDDNLKMAESMETNFSARLQTLQSQTSLLSRQAYGEHFKHLLFRLGSEPLLSATTHDRSLSGFSESSVRQRFEEF